MIEVFLSTPELAERWEGLVVAGTLKNWRHKKKGPKYIKFGKGKNSHIGYRLSDVEDYEKKMTKQTGD